MKEREALKLALEAWERGDGIKLGEILKEALAQPEQDSVAMADYMALVEKYALLKASKPEQEPVAWLTETGSVWKSWAEDTDKPLYTTPPQRKPLTDEQCKTLWAFEWKGERVQFIRAIEAAHGIKGDK